MNAALTIVAVLLTAEAAAQPAKTTPLPAQPQRTLSVPLEGTDLYNAIVDDATDAVMAKVRERENGILATVGIVATISLGLLAFLGIPSYADLRRQIQERIVSDIRNQGVISAQVSAAVENQVTGELERRLASLSDQLALSSLYNLANQLQSGTGFTNAERDIALSSLRQLKDNVSINQRPEFSDSVEKIVEAFAAAGIGQYIDEIDDTLSELTTTTGGIAFTRVQHYARRHIGNYAYDADVYQRFARYLNACERIKADGLAVAFRMGAEQRYKQEGYKNRIAELIKDYTYLGDKSKQNAKTVFTDWCDPNKLSRQPDGEIVRVAEVYTSINDEYGDQLK